MALKLLAPIGNTERSWVKTANNEQIVVLHWDI